MPIGIAIGCISYFSWPVEPGLWGAMILLGLFGVSVSLIRFFLPNQMIIYTSFWAVLLITGGFCVAWIQTHRQPLFYQLPNRATIIQGKIQQVEILPTLRRRITLKQVHFVSTPENEQGVFPRLLRFTMLSSDTQSVQVGDRVSVRLLLNSPPPPSIVGGFDLQFYAWFNGMGGYGRALNPIVKTKESQENSLQYIREHIAQRIIQILPNSSGAMAQILLTGITTQLSQEDRHAFAVSGLAHLLAIAGLHLGIVMTMVTVIVRKGLIRSEYIALYWPVKSIALGTGLGAGCIYVLLTGMHLPALRSLIMASIIVMALLYRRQAFSMHNLMLAALCLLIFAPSNVLSISFQMSMAAVMALIAGYKRLYSYFLFKNIGSGFLKDFFIFHIGNSALVSILAGLAVMPVVMAHFNEIQPYFIFANLVAVPLTALWILPWGMVALLLMPFGLDVWPLKLMGLGTELIVLLARHIASWPNASLYVASIPGWGLGLYFFGLCILCLCVTRLRWVGCFLIAGSLLTLLWVKIPDIVTSPNGRMIGIRQHHILWVACQGGCDSFIVKQWQQMLNIKHVQFLSMQEQSGWVYCQKDFCRIDQMHLLIVRQKITRFLDKEQFCKGINLEISFMWKGGFCSNIPVIDKRSNWIEGAHSVQLAPLKIKTDLDYRGRRLWVKELIQRGSPNLPMAQSE